jgi:mono/diheme cytochrome c family protein
MRKSRLFFLGAMLAVVGCAAATTNFRPPLEARLGAGAKTGSPVPLRFDPNAKVVIARVANLPPAPYTAAQAARGEQVYNSTCASCHQNEKFIGKEFVDNWGDRRVGDFYQLVRQTMPVDNPGGLKDQQYLDVTAYILKANHATATTDSLSPDTTIMRGRKIGIHP